MDYVDPSQVPELPLESMNSDHVEEFRLLAQLGDALTAHRRGGGSELLLERLSLLAVHTREHFLREEQVMRESRYDGYLAHKQEHDRVLAEMNAEAQAFRESRDAERLARYLLDTVPGWYLHHTRTMDLAAARWAADRGLSAAPAPQRSG
jgi:hemerythrin